MAFGPVGRITAVVLPVLLLGGAPASRAAGEPVVDLKATDLILRVVRPRWWISRRNTEVPSLLAPPFATNAAVQSARGDIAVLIDEASIAPGREQGMRDAVTHFLSRTSPADRVRLISLRSVGPALPFEEGLRDLPAALARFTGHSTASETANDLVCRSQTALDMLRSLVGNYSGGPMPTFVIVSGGFGSPPSGGVTSFGNYGKCPPLRGLDFEELGGAARAINAAIYVVHLTDATGSRLPRTDLERGVETLAGALGADVIRAVAPSPASMAKIATQTSSYYLAGFDLDSSDRADAPLRIELRSRRPDVTIRARQELPGRRAATTIAVPLPDAMIRVPTTYRDLALRAAAFPSRADSDGHRTLRKVK